MMKIQVYARCAFASVLALWVVSGQNMIDSSPNDNIESIRIRRKMVRKLGSSASASSYYVDTSSVSGPFYIIRQDVNGDLYAQISETDDMNQYVTVSCTKDGHHPIIVSCPYGGSPLNVHATEEFAIHKMTYHDAYGKEKVMQVDTTVGHESQDKVLGKSMTYEEMKQVEAFHANQSTDASSSMEESSSTNTVHKLAAIATISVVSVLLLCIFTYCACLHLIEDDDDSDDEDDEFDDDDQSLGKCHDSHTSVTHKSVISISSLFDVADLSNNESENDDNVDNDHIYKESTKTIPPTRAESTTIPPTNAFSLK